MDKDFYNRSSAQSLGWDPTWFGEKYFDEKLVRAIKRFQKQYGLTADGLCGPATFRRLWLERQESIDDHKPDDPHYSNYIVYNGEFTPIKWDKLVLWSERGGLAARLTMMEQSIRLLICNMPLGMLAMLTESLLVSRSQMLIIQNTKTLMFVKDLVKDQSLMVLGFTELS
jgi:hypothetical protein